MKRLIALVICVTTLLSAVGVRAMNIATYSFRYGSATDIVVDGKDDLWVRDMLEWAEIEQTKGEIVIPEYFRERYKRITQEGKKIVLVLCYGNPIYSGTTNVVMPTVSNKTYFDAWINYVSTMVNEFKDIVDHFEIWNEPNLSYANSNASAAEYAELCVETKKVIEKIQPQAVVIGGAIAYARSHSQFVRDFYNNGGNQMDGISFHIYDYANVPEDKWESVLLAAFEDLMDSLDCNLPLWFTETGYCTGTGGNAVSEELQAAYLIRMQALWDNYLKTEEREGEMFWFFTNDWTTDSGDTSGNHGLIDVNGVAKDSYYTFKALNRLITDKVFDSMIVNNAAYRAIYKDELSKDELYIMWNKYGNEQTNTIAYDCDEARIYNYKGELLDCLYGSGNVAITFDDKPKMVELVNYGTSIKRLDYIQEKGILNISGECNFTDVITLEIEKDENIIKSIEVPVTDGEFEKEIYINEIGSVIVYAGRPEAGANYYDSKEIELNSINEVSINATVVANGANVSISGEVENAEDGTALSIIVIPQSVEQTALNSYNLAHIGEMTVSKNKFSHSFSMPENSEGKYRICISGQDVVNVFNQSLEYGESNQFVGVLDFEVKKTAEIAVTAMFNNTDEEDRSAQIIVAQYDNEGALIKAETDKVTVAAGTVLAKPYSASFELDEKAITVKAFVFDNFENIRPLVPCAVPKE